MNGGATPDVDAMDLALMSVPGVIMLEALWYAISNMVFVLLPLYASSGFS